MFRKKEKKPGNEIRKEEVKNRKPIFLIIGLIAIVLVTIAIYMIFLNFKEIMRIEYDGYAISGKEITENLLGNSSEDDKNLSLIPVKEQDKLYKKLNSYFIGENKRDEINLEYPIYINNNSTIYNLSENIMLITSSFETIAGYPNLTVVDGGIYNQSDLERMDNTEYFFLKNENNIYTSLKEIKISTIANEYILPINSNICFDKERIRYYEVKDNKLIFKEIKDIDNNSRVQIGDREVSYQELLTKLRIPEEKENINMKEEIIKEDSSKESETKQEEVKKKTEEEIKKEEENTEGKYVKPQVSCSSFTSNVYTISTNLSIQDPSGVIVSNIIFEIKKEGQIYLRKAFYNSGNVQITGLEPNTNYEIEGTYIYLNEQGQKVENTFYKGRVETKGVEELNAVEIEFENGEIFENKIQIKRLKIVSDLKDEVIKGIRRANITIKDVRYEIKNEQLSQLLNGKEITYETNESIRSDQTIDYEINFYDKKGNRIKIYGNGNKGRTRTSKRKPSVNISIIKQNIIDLTLGIKLNNKDKVEIKNYHYTILKSNGENIEEKGIEESTKELFLEDLDENQYYTIKIYGDYDLKDEKGNQENQEIGNAMFTTQAISSLGYVNLNLKPKVITADTSKMEIKIDENTTDKRLIQIISKLEVALIKAGKKDSNLKEERGEIVSKETIEGEELQKLKIGEGKELIYENLDSNTIYKIEMLAEVTLGNTIQEVRTTSNQTEFITLKKEAQIEIRNLFVTGDMIDFDVRIEDPDHASLTNQVRMELRDEETNPVKLINLETNQEEYARQTIEKLEKDKDYTLVFYADQYNIGSTNETYQKNYQIKEMTIHTEIGISGKIGLSELSKKGYGKNLIDVSSEINWYVYPNFNTGDYYGKEYDSITKTLTLGGHGNNRRAVYDLQEYAGQTVTMSFKAKLVTEGSNGNSIVYIQNKKTDVNRTLIKGLATDEWKEFSYTMKLDSSGYLGFYIQGGNGIQIQELQIELGEQKTKYEEFESILQANVVINLEDKRNEISTNNYFVKIYRDGKLVEEREYEELTEENKKIEAEKKYLVEINSSYQMDLVVKINGREYILDSQSFETKDGREIKGIRNLDDWLELKQNGEYIVLDDIDLSGLKYRFGGNNLPFRGKIDFNGHTLTRDTSWNDGVMWINEGTIENLVFNVRMNNKVEMNGFRGFADQNKGTIENIQINLIESTEVPNINIYLFTAYNYGSINKFILNLKVPFYGKSSLTGIARVNNGKITNGYVFGENLKAIYGHSGEIKNASFIGENSTSSSMVKNVYSLSTIDVHAGANGYGIICNNSPALLENVYTVGLGENYNLNYDPNVYVANSSKVTNSYYINEQIFNTNSSRKTTELALYDTTFQNQILNSEHAFVVDELVQKGYYPQLDMPDCMPNQEYIKLPEITDEDLPDILSTEVIEQGTTRVKVKFRVHNPSGETITKIEIKNVNCDILSQNYENGISDVIVELNNPVLCVSTYSILSMTTKGAYGLPFIRTFKEKERIIDVELFREIYFISDWEGINKSPTENYKLMTDLNFANEGSNICITRTYEGKLDGNGHTIRNIEIPSNMQGLISILKGELSNLYVRNFKMVNNSTNGKALIRLSTNGLVRGVHMIDVRIEGSSVGSGDLVVGGLVAKSERVITRERLYCSKY